MGIVPTVHTHNTVVISCCGDRATSPPTQHVIDSALGPVYTRRLESCLRTPWRSLRRRLLRCPVLCVMVDCNTVDGSASAEAPWRHFFSADVWRGSVASTSVDTAPSRCASRSADTATIGDSRDADTATSIGAELIARQPPPPPPLLPQPLLPTPLLPPPLLPPPPPLPTPPCEEPLFPRPRPADLGGVCLPEEPPPAIAFT